MTDIRWHGFDALALRGALRHDPPSVAPIVRLMRDHGAAQMRAVARSLCDDQRSDRDRRIGLAVRELLAADRQADKLGVHLTDRPSAAIDAVEAAREE